MDLWNVIEPGTTSAYAENAHVVGHNYSCSGNYLRVRGEYGAEKANEMAVTELPPRARRILGDAGKAVYRGGTTSACAENTSWCRGNHQSPGNYLRVRGEYSLLNHENRAAWELPPRARRIPFAFKTKTNIFGTTSACAENTSLRSNHRQKPGNYLRVRGEYPIIFR